jgi:NitT/TauT family transport system ATP-binding protein
LAPRPGRIDSVYEVPLPMERGLEMKQAPEFLKLRARIVERIRDTSGIRTDLELLQKLSKRAAD